MRQLLATPQKAFDKLKRLKVGALFMEAGTAKTSAAYALVNSLNAIDYVLYLAPYQTIFQEDYFETIRAEIQKCGGFKMKHDFIGIESLSNSDRIYLEIRDNLIKAHKPFIICDESLKIKNSQAKRTRRILELSTLVEYKLILNGTPLSRNLLDLWPQMEFLSPRILRMDETKFKNTFCSYTTIVKRIANKTLRKEWINGYENINYLYKLIEPFVFDAKLDLHTQIQILPIKFNLSEDEIAIHRELKETYLNDESLEIYDNNIFMKITQKMQHSYSLSPEKFIIVDNLIKKYGVEKILICAKYVDSQQELKKHYPNIRVLSWQKNSMGLNLQKYSVLIKWDKHWDYALHDQLLHRIYRTGQKENCTIIELTGNVGLEKLMDKNIVKKGSLLKGFKLESFKKTIQSL
ncbi:MAG: SNF2-related protein [Bacteroidales bacterium]